MRFNVVINQEKCLEYNLTINQAAMVTLLNELSSWAVEKWIDGKLYWHISRNKIIEELPLFFEKSDTVYRNFKALEKLGIIEFITKNKMDFIRLTDYGRSWNKLGLKSENVKNSDLNPIKLGFESEKLKKVSFDNQIVNHKNSDLNPTYNNNNYTNNKKEENALAYLIKNSLSEWENFQMRFKKNFKSEEWEKFQELFDCKFNEEGKEFSVKTISSRLTRFAINYCENLKKAENKEKGSFPIEVSENHPSRRKIA